MTEIRFEDVRVGDRVRVTTTYRDDGNTVRTLEGNVAWINQTVIGFSDMVLVADWGEMTTIELLSRPVPEAVCGEIRTHSSPSGCKFVRTSAAAADEVQWYGISGPCRGTKLKPSRPYDADVIADLVPVDPS